MPTLETLKKQAKLLVRWRRERLFTVAARLRAGLPRLAGLTDAEVLDQPFSLADAQGVIAAEQGFASWAALKKELEAMPTPVKTAATPTAPRLKLVEATLFVSDFGVSRRYFEEVLGFSAVFTYGEPPFYGQVARDGVPLNLRLVCEPVFVGDVREREELLAATIGCSSVKALYEEFKAAGAEFNPESTTVRARRSISDGTASTSWCPWCPWWSIASLTLPVALRQDLERGGPHSASSAVPPTNEIRLPSGSLTTKLMAPQGWRLIPCLKVHRALGPGLLESAYEHCLAHELGKRGLVVRRQVMLPLSYDGLSLDAGYRLDLLVEEAIVVEVKAVEALTRLHEAQVLTYLRLSKRRLGLLINFNVELFKHGVRRFAL